MNDCLGCFGDQPERSSAVVGSRLGIKAEGDIPAAARDAIRRIVVAGVLGHDGVPLSDRRGLARSRKADRGAQFSLLAATPFKEKFAVPTQGQA